jgi:hypothetical protein
MELVYRRLLTTFEKAPSRRETGCAESTAMGAVGQDFHAPTRSMAQWQSHAHAWTQAKVSEVGDHRLPCPSGC